MTIPAAYATNDAIKDGMMVMALRLRPNRSASVRAKPASMIAIALCVLIGGLAQSTPRANFEAEQDVATKSLLGNRVPMQGKGYRLPTTTPIRDFMGRFRVDTDVGTLEAVGSDELAERLADLPAVRRLQALSQTDMFRKALAEAAKSTGQAITRVIAEPVETLAALPSGVGRVLLNVGRRARDIAANIGDAAKRADQPAAQEDATSDVEAADSVVDFGKELAGVNKARRAIARELGIDPYTRNPLLAARLEELAWASVAGGISLDLAMNAIPKGGRDILEVADRIDDLAWDAPPADVRRLLEQRLRARGHGGFEAREFLRNAAFSPSQQLQLVALLDALDVRVGESALLAHAARVPGPRHASFLLRQLKMLEAASRNASIRELRVDDGLAIAVTERGTLLLPLPVDQLSWTESIATAGTIGRPRQRVDARLLVTGNVTPLSRKNLAALGWRVTSGHKAD